MATRYFVRAQLNLSGSHTPTRLLTRESKEPAYLQAQHAVVPGGRIELPTPAFSGPRSTGELPRHRHKRRFYGAHAQESNGPLILVNGAARHGGGKSGSRLARFSNAQCRHLRVRGAPTTLVRVVRERAMSTVTGSFSRAFGVIKAGAAPIIMLHANGFHDSASCPGAKAPSSILRAATFSTFPGRSKEP